MEQRDLYDINRKLTGKTIFKGDSIPENSYIIVVLVFIQNSEGKFLIQKRSKIKNGKYATTGGHPKFGEDSVQGIISEVKEEVESVCWLSIDEVHSLIKDNNFFRNHYQEFEILLNWLKEGKKNVT